MTQSVYACEAKQQHCLTISDSFQIWASSVKYLSSSPLVASCLVFNVSPGGAVQFPAVLLAANSYQSPVE